MTTVQHNYIPHPKQELFHRSAANEILFGGSAGPGKSRSLREELLYWCLRIPNLQAYLFRRSMPELERNHIIPSQMEFPAGPCSWRQQKNRWEFTNNAMIHMCHALYETSGHSNVLIYQGAEIHILAMDELTSFTPFQIKYLTSRVRCTLDIPEHYRHKIPGFYAASNPGGPSHQYVKARFIDSAKPMEIHQAPDDEGGMMRQYIPALLHDNPTLTELDPEYVHRIEALPEPYRTAYLKGDWDIFLGQMFAFFNKPWQQGGHLTDPIPIPDEAPLLMTYDWGWGAPYSIGWWWIDGDGRLWRCTELYGMMRDQPNVGLKQPDDVVAQRIIDHEKQHGIWGRPITRLAGHDCWAQRPDWKGGGGGPSTAETFAKMGLMLEKSSPSRAQKIRQFSGRLQLQRDPVTKEIVAPPMLVVYNTCIDFIRTIPELMPDPHNQEDVDTTMEDHGYDEACQACMHRAIGPGMSHTPRRARRYAKRG